MCMMVYCTTLAEERKKNAQTHKHTWCVCSCGWLYCDIIYIIVLFHLEFMLVFGASVNQYYFFVCILCMSLRVSMSLRFDLVFGLHHSIHTPKQIQPHLLMVYVYVYILFFSRAYTISYTDFFPVHFSVGMSSTT